MTVFLHDFLYILCFHFLNLFLKVKASENQRSRMSIFLFYHVHLLTDCNTSCKISTYRFLMHLD